jgi:hypothetical protein
MAFLIALQWLDFLSTVLGFSRGASELSPVVRALSHVVNPVIAVLLSKVLVTAAVWRLRRKIWALRLTTVWYCGIVAWNVFILSILR